MKNKKNKMILGISIVSAFLNSNSRADSLSEKKVKLSNIVKNGIIICDRSNDNQVMSDGSKTERTEKPTK